MASYDKLGLILLCAGIQLVASGCHKKKAADVVEKLLSEDGQTIVEARDELLATRKDLTGRLISIIEDKKNLQKKQASVEAAMFVLGEIRAVEAIEVLVDHIGYPYVLESPGGQYSAIVTGGRTGRGLKGMQKVCPAVPALIKIGEPCLNGVISKLASTDNTLECRACLSVLVGLRERESVIEILDKAIGKEKEAERRDRLHKSLDWLSQLPEDEI